MYTNGAWVVGQDRQNTTVTLHAFVAWREEGRKKG